MSGIQTGLIVYRCESCEKPIPGLYWNFFWDEFDDLVRWLDQLQYDALDDVPNHQQQQSEPQPRNEVAPDRLQVYPPDDLAGRDVWEYEILKSEDIPKKYMDGIIGDILSDPVAASDGHVYEK